MPVKQSKKFAKRKPQSCSSSPFFQFLKLPVEIRVMIYHLVFDVPAGSERYEIKGPIEVKTLSPSLTRSGKRIRSSDSSYCAHGTPEMAAVFTCSQVYFEAGPVFYASRIFTFSEYKCMSSFISMLGKQSPLGTLNLDAVRRISIRRTNYMPRPRGIIDDKLALLEAAAVLLPRIHYIEVFIWERLGSEEWCRPLKELARWCGTSPSWRNALLIGPYIDLRNHGMSRCVRHPASRNWREAFLFSCDSAVESSNWKIEPKFWHNQHCKVVEDTLGLNFDSY